MSAGTVPAEAALSDRPASDGSTGTAIPAQPARSADELRAVADGVWAALQVLSPQGIDSTQLGDIAAEAGVGLDVLLDDGDTRERAEPAAPIDDTQASAEDQNLGANLSKIAVLSSAPRTGVGGGTSLRETFRSALHNLGANKTRGVLTMLGIIIGVGAVVLLLAIGNGLLGYVNDLTGQYGANNVTIQPARLIAGGVDTGALTRTLSLADAQALAAPGAVPDALAVSPIVQTRALIQVGSANFATTLLGVWPDYLTAGGYSLNSGSFVTEDDVTNGTPVVVLGANVAHTLFGESDPIGQTVWLNGVSLRVVGEMAALESLITGGDDSVFVPLSTMLNRLYRGPRSTIDGSPALDMIVLRAEASTAIASVQDESTTLLTTRHHLGGGSPDFTTNSLLSALQQRAQILAAINAFMAVVAGISLLVGGIGIMNIMLVSVAERTREIGLRKAIGARSRDILNQFLVESTVISLVGAGIGVGIAAFLIVLISVLWRPCPPSIVGSCIAVLAALGIGLFFGISPARRAAALQPIEALRAE